MTGKTRSAALAVLTIVAVVSACEHVSETRTERKAVDLGGATSAEVRVKMGAGELELGGGAPGLMEASFTTNVRRWEPRVDYSVFGGKGRLSVGQRRGGGLFLGHSKNEWTVRLGGAVPIDLEVGLGAGESTLDLRGLDLRSLEINMGVGEMKLDLSGPLKRSLRATIDGGVGHGTVILPREIGVKVEIDGGIGSVSARGLNKTGPGHVYTNDAYGRTDISLELKIDAGIGSIDLKIL